MGTEPDIEAIKLALTRFNHWSGWCTIAVFLGLVVEYATLLWTEHKNFSRTKLVITLLAAIVIAGGVYGEYVSGSKAAEAAIKLENISEARLTDAVTREADLEGENSDLRTFMQPRRARGFKSAADWEESKSATGLREFFGIPLLVQTLPDTEPTTLATDIVSLTGGLGWKTRFITPAETLKEFTAMVPGVQIFTLRPTHVPPNSRKNLRDRGWAAGEALAKFLGSENVLEVEHLVVPSLEDFPFSPFRSAVGEDAVMVFIGPRYMPFELAVIRDRREKKQNTAQPITTTGQPSGAEGDADVHTSGYWIVNHADRILALLAILIAAIAIVDVRRLFTELEERDRNTEERVRHAVLMELLTHTSSFAAYSRATQFIDFNEGQPDKQTAIAMLMSFHIEQLLAPLDATPEQLAHLRQSAREKMEEKAKEYAETIVSAGIGKLKDNWSFS